MLTPLPCCGANTNYCTPLHNNDVAVAQMACVHMVWELQEHLQSPPIPSTTLYTGYQRVCTTSVEWCVAVTPTTTSYSACASCAPSGCVAVTPTATL